MPDKVTCDCGEVIELEPNEAQEFAIVECPACGTDVSLEGLYNPLGDDPMGDYYGRNY